MSDMAEKGRAHGPQQGGEDNPSAILDWQDVREIRRLYSTGRYSQADLSSIYCVSSDAIGRVVRNETWKNEDYIPDKSAFGATLSRPRPYRWRISPEQARRIIEIKEDTGKGNREIGKMFGVSKTTIASVVKGEHPACHINES
jgi:hypothetical protein